MSSRQDEGPRRRPITAAFALTFVVVALSLLALRLVTAPGPDAPASIDDRAPASETEQPLSGAEVQHPAEPGMADGDGGLRVARAPIALQAVRVVADPAAVGGALSGEVRARGSGRPVVGAELTFAADGVTRSATSDASGAFLFAPAAPGEHALAMVTADGFLPFAPEWGTSPIRVTLAPGVRLEGARVILVEEVRTTVSVVDADGAPVAGATVRAFGLDRGERALAPLRATWTTDATGEASVLVPDRAVVEAQEGTRRGRARLDASAQVSHRLRITLTDDHAFAGALPIGGWVVDGRGDGVEGASVVAWAQHPGGRRLYPTLFATAAADGRFGISGADEGRYRLVVTAPGFSRGALDGVRAGTDDARIELAAGARLSVRVVDSDGAPVAAASVIVERAAGRLQMETLAVTSGYSPDGVVEVGGLVPGTCRVTVSSPGYAMASVSATATATESSPVEVRLRRGARLRGRVSSADDAAIEGARVTLEGLLGSGSSAVPLELNASTDAEGAFVLEGAPAGLASVVVFAEGHHGRVRSAIVVPEAGEVDVGTIDLTPVQEGEEPGLELAGIGAILSAEGDALVVGDVIASGGAAEAGLAPGDAILTIDGVPVEGLGFGGCIERIRGPEGTLVQLAVRRAGTDDVAQVAVLRRRIRA